jgi:hypothetical protein
MTSISRANQAIRRDEYRGREGENPTGERPAVEQALRHNKIRADSTELIKSQTQT